MHSSRSHSYLRVRRKPPLVHIHGDGLIALAFSLFLARQGIPSLRVHSEETPSSSSSSLQPKPDVLNARPLALSLGSTQLLSRIILLPTSVPIQTVQVRIPYQTRGLVRPIFSSTTISAAELAQPTLGCVARYGALHEQLSQAAQQLDADKHSIDADAFETIRVDTSRSFGEKEDHVLLDYQQTAVMAEIETTHRTDNTAYEYFTQIGPLALLPLPESETRYGLIWCVQNAEGQRLSQLSPSAFDAELSKRLGHGNFSVSTLRCLIPLVGQRYRRYPCQPNHVVIGDAAQTLHPVAGQGFNLGLRDAFVFAQQLGDAHASGHSLEATTARYPLTRSIDRWLLTTLTDGLAIKMATSPIRPIVAACLQRFGGTSLAKRAIARAFMFGWRA